MRTMSIGRLVLALALVAGMPLAAARADGPKAWVDPSFPPLHQADPGWSRGARQLPPVSRRHLRQRPVIACDPYGRCWQRVPPTRWDGGYDDDRSSARPPGWADDLPRRTREPGRFLRPRDGVVCDQASGVCYKRGRIDKSETRGIFGDRAADRADDLRDDFGTGRLFVPERGVTCDPGRRVCFDDGGADFSLTRRYFGNRAANALD